jgi:hypothetical protein
MGATPRGRPTSPPPPAGGCRSAAAPSGCRKPPVARQRPPSRATTPAARRHSSGGVSTTDSSPAGRNCWWYGMPSPTKYTGRGASQHRREVVEVRRLARQPVLIGGPPAALEAGGEDLAALASRTTMRCAPPRRVRTPARPPRHGHDFRAGRERERLGERDPDPQPGERSRPDGHEDLAQSAGAVACAGTTRRSSAECRPRLRSPCGTRARPAPARRHEGDRPGRPEVSMARPGHGGMIARGRETRITKPNHEWTTKSEGAPALCPLRPRLAVRSQTYVYRAAVGRRSLPRLPARETAAPVTKRVRATHVASATMDGAWRAPSDLVIGHHSSFALRAQAPGRIRWRGRTPVQI